MNPVTDGGGETTIGPQPELTVGVGAAGNTTNSLLPLHTFGSGVVYVAVKHPGVVGENTPVDELMVPPPLTVHVPPGGAPVYVKFTFPPPTQEFGAVTFVPV